MCVAHQILRNQLNGFVPQTAASEISVMSTRGCANHAMPLVFLVTVQATNIVLHAQLESSNTKETCVLTIVQESFSMEPMYVLTAAQESSTTVLIPVWTTVLESTSMEQTDAWIAVLESSTME